MSPLPKRRFTPEEYLAMERASEFKHEYADGEIWPRGEPRPIAVSEAEAQARHEDLVAAVAAVLDARITDPPFNVVRDVAVGNARADVAVMTENAEGVEKQSPLLVAVIAVLSPYTEGDDRSWKFESYRRMPSIADYLLLSQERSYAEHFTRFNQDQWTLQDHDGLNSVISLPSPGCELRLADIYERITFPDNSRLPGE